MSLDLITDISAITVGKALSSLRDGLYAVPEFQRDYTWNEEDVVDLLNSIFNNIPIGSIQIWETEEEIPVRRKFSEQMNYGIYNYYILDGQQRLTTLYHVAFGGDDLTVDFNSIMVDTTSIIGHSTERAITSKEYKELDSKAQSRYKPLSHIMYALDNDCAFRRKMKELFPNESERDIVRELRYKFITTKFGLISTRTNNLEHAKKIFYQVNVGGRRLTLLDNASAMLFTKIEDGYFNFYDESKEVIKRSGMKGLSETDILKSATIALFNEFNEAGIVQSLERHAVRIIDNWESISKAILSAADYISREYNTNNVTDLAVKHIFYLHVLLYYKDPKLSEDSWKLKEMRKYTIHTMLTGRYSERVTSMVREDIEWVISLHDDNEKFTRVLPDYEDYLYITREDIIESSSKKLVLLIMKMSWKITIDGRPVSVSTKRGIELHHIFPKAQYLEKYPELTESTFNILLLDASNNSKIGDSHPSEYMRKYNPPQEYYEENMLPKESLLNDNINKFIKERKKYVYSRIEELYNYKED